MRLDSLLTSILPTPLTVSALLLCLASALVLGILTALVFTRGCRHTASFALTLALLPMSVALVIMMVNGSIGTGLAVAGTFALVRFRSVPGTAREIAAISPLSRWALQWAWECSAWRWFSSCWPLPPCWR